MKKALNAFLLFAAMLVAIPCSTGCAWWAENKGDVKTVVQTVDDVAQSLCGVFYGDKMNISVQDAVKTFCNAREKYEPWIDQVLAGAKAGGDIKLGVKSVVPVPAAVQAPAPLPVPVTELGSPWAATPAPTAASPVPAATPVPTTAPPAKGSQSPATGKK